MHGSHRGYFWRDGSAPFTKVLAGIVMPNQGSLCRACACIAAHNKQAINVYRDTGFSSSAELHFIRQWSPATRCFNQEITLRWLCRAGWSDIATCHLNLDMPQLLRAHRLEANAIQQLRPGQVQLLTAWAELMSPLPWSKDQVW